MGSIQLQDETVSVPTVPVPLDSRRDFLKYSAVSTASVALPFSMTWAASNVFAATSTAITYNLKFNTGGNLLLNSGGFMLLEQVFPGPFDSDGDGLSDELEILIGTDATNPDSDGDTLLDGYEVAYDGDPSSYSSATDLNPLSADTDGDGFNDNVEITNSSNPLNASSKPVSIAAPLLTPLASVVLGIATFLVGCFEIRKDE